MARTTHELDAIYKEVPSAAAAPVTADEGFVTPDCVGIGHGTLYFFGDAATPVTLLMYVDGAWRVFASIVLAAAAPVKVLVPGRARLFVRPTAATGTFLAVVFSSGTA